MVKNLISGPILVHVAQIWAHQFENMAKKPNSSPNFCPFAANVASSIF